MNNKVLFISLFFIYIASYSQSNNISVERIYKELNDKSLHYIKFSDTINLIQGDQINKKKKLDFLLLDISIPHNLKFKKFTNNNPNTSFYFRDSIFLFDKKFCLDNLFYGKKTLKNEEPLRLNYASGYTFLLKSKKYISLFFWDSTLPTSNPHFFIILFDITNINNIKPYFFDEQMSFNPYCFGDFNNDGKLDFANWKYDEKLYYTTLTGNKYKTLKNKFVLIKESSIGIFYIDWEKSNWFKKK